MRVRLKLDRLQQLLAASALSQNHWAIRVGISKGHWSDIVNGRHPYPSAKTRLRMLEVFERPLDELFEIEPGDTGWADTDFRHAIRDRYLIDSDLGQGAMGSVHLARDAARGRIVALKSLASEAVCGVGVNAFLREISVVSRLQHPNILPLFDSGAVADQPFYVMPWIREGSLRERLRRDTRLDLDTTLAFTAGIAAGLTHAHGERVLHCDVKPENILLQGRHAYVMDFGISRIIHAEVSEFRARKGYDLSAGTPAYVSPEQASGEADIDGRADVYSLGCVVYEMLTGRPPFEGTTTEAIVARRFLSPPPPIRDFAPEVPPRVADAVARAMEIDRNKRPATPDAFVAELRVAVARTNPVLARLSLAATRAVGAIRRRTGRAPANTLGGRLMQFAQDLRLTVRSLRRDWRFALAFVVPLALGLGAGATFYSIVDHVLFRPPPGVREPHRLVRVAISNKQFPDPFRAGNLSTSWLDIEALRKTAGLSSVAGFIAYPAPLGRGPDARRIPAMLVTASYFDVVGVRAQRGRFFTVDEDAVTSSLVPCVAGDRFWRAQLGGADDALGRRLQVGRIECEVVGVAPTGFNGTGYTPVDLWLPLRASGEGSHGDARLWTTDGSHWIRLIARPRAGATAADLNREATDAYRSVAGRARDPKLEYAMVTEPLMGSPSVATSQRMRTAGWLAAGAAALVLLVGANLVNLLVARNIGRVRETAIRLALGGSRARLLAHQVMESAVLAAVAGGIALLLVRWLGPVARAVLYPGTAWADGPVTGRIVGIAIAASLLIGGAIAGVAAWYASRVDPAALLGAGGGARATASRSSHRVRMALVGIQAALATVLLIASTGFVRSFRAAAGSSLGFEMKGMIFAEIPNLRTAIPDAAGQGQFLLELRERVRALPGVEGVSLAYNTPWYYNRNEELREPGRDSLPRIPGYTWPAFDAVTPDHLANMRVAMRAGRWLTDADDAGAPPVMVVSASMAALYWGDDRAAVGRCLYVGNAAGCREVVGVADDIRFMGGLDANHTPSYYIPLAQSGEFVAFVKLFVRARGDAARLVPALRQLMQGARPALPPADVHPMQQHLDPLLASWRLGATAYTALGALSAAIAMLGLFSVMAYLVAERRREFAIRSALGARMAQLVGPVVGQAVVVVGAGAAAGLLVAWRSEKWLQPQLYHSQLLEPAVVATLVGALIVVAILAVLGPARRAATLDPSDALRAE